MHPNPASSSSAEAAPGAPLPQPSGRKTGLILAAAGLAVLATGWVGAGAWIGSRTEAELQALLKTAPGAAGQFRLVKLDHQRGLLTSKGVAELQLQPGCGAAAGDDPPMSMQVSYELSHLPLPTSALRFSWQAAPQGETGAVFKKIFGQAATLTGQGQVSLAGALRTDMALPALSLQRAGESVQASASTGFLQVHGPALALGWNTDSLILRGGGNATEMKGLKIDLDLQDRTVGIGHAAFELAELQAPMARLQGLALRSVTTEHDGRLDMHLTPSLAHLEANDQKVDELALEFALDGVDRQSVATLTKVFTDSCGFTALTARESEQVRGAVQTLLTRGFAAGISRIAGRTAEASISGQWTFKLEAAANQQIAIDSQARSSGELILTGSLISPEQRGMAVQMGLAQDIGNGLKASYRYEPGRLEFNGRTLDAAPVQAVLAAANAQVRSTLASLGRPDATLARQGSHLLDALLGDMAEHEANAADEGVEPPASPEAAAGVAPIEAQAQTSADAASR